MNLFEFFRNRNVARCNAAFRPHEDWSLTDWALALVGEAGEVCNEVKKLRRNDNTGSKEKLAEEIADVFTYLDLLAARAGIDLWPVIVDKFNKVSRARNCSIELEHESIWMVHVSEVSGSVFVKERDFFISQGGLSQAWGKAWYPVKAASLEHAREIGRTNPIAREVQAWD